MSGPSADRVVVDWSTQQGTGLGGFVSSDDAVRREKSRRQVRIAALLAIGLWSIVAVVLHQHPPFDGAAGALAWFGGIAVIASLALHRMRIEADALAASVVVDDRGRVVGSADDVGKRLVTEQAAPALLGFSVFHFGGNLIRAAGLPEWVALLAIVAGVATYFAIRRQQRAAR